MDRRFKIYIGLFVSLVLAILFYESSKPKVINWIPSYVQDHKIPYGTYVLKNQLTNLFPKSNIEDVRLAPFQFLESDDRTGTYIFINDIIGFDDVEFLRLMEFVKRGNDVFISSHGFEIDTLNIRTERLLSGEFKEEVIFKMNNKRFPSTEYSFDREFNNQVFEKVDTLNTLFLGKTAFLNDQGERDVEGTNFIKQQFGKGNFYFHTFPELFTNYNILKENNDAHAAAVLSYLGNPETIYWDTYYKTGKKTYSSLLIHVLENDQLKWAYYIVLIAIAFFVVFNGKRTQRVIPVVTPLRNQTLAFTRTIANMYYEKSEHKNIAEHKISYLLDFIRVKLRIPTNKRDKVFYAFVASRSGYSVDEVKVLFEYCERIHLKNRITKEELLKLNSLIEDFKKSIV